MTSADKDKILQCEQALAAARAQADLAALQVQQAGEALAQAILDAWWGEAWQLGEGEITAGSLWLRQGLRIARLHPTGGLIGMTVWTGWASNDPSGLTQHTLPVYKDTFAEAVADAKAFLQRDPP